MVVKWMDCSMCRGHYDLTTEHELTVGKLYCSQKCREESESIFDHEPFTLVVGRTRLRWYWKAWLHTETMKGTVYVGDGRAWSFNRATKRAHKSIDRLRTKKEK